MGVGAGAGSDENARAYDAILANEPTVSLDEHVARTAGRLEGEHLQSDEKPDLGPVDAVVAATGLTVGEPILSRDADLETVDGLSVRQW